MTPERDRFIPVRKADILDALIDHGRIAGAVERDQFRQLCRILTAIFHYDYFEQLEKLRHAYFYFDPELDRHPVFSRATLQQAYAELIESLIAVLKDANFVELSAEEVEAAHRESAAVAVATEAPLDDFRDVRFFRRGHHQESFHVKRWFGLRDQKLEAVAYDDVVLLASMKSPDEIASGRERDRLSKRHMRPGSILIKYFRDIACADLKSLYPDARVVMTTFDKLFLAVPAIAGAIPILLNIASTITVLFLVIGFYLGMSAAVEDSEMKAALAALSGLVALGGFIARQWVKYQRQSLKHQMQITDKIYYRNINNNAGIFDYIIGAAEEQECKEAFLAYYFLRTMPSPPTQTELDEHIEQWLRDTFGVDVDFEVDDALAKLDRLELLRRDGERLSVPPPESALARLDYVWDNYFQFNVDAAAKEATATASA